MTRWLDRLFPLPLPSQRAKPEEILYGIDERPPLRILLSSGLQHVLLGLMFSLYAVIAGRGIGLEDAAVAQYVGSCIFIWGLGTVLIALRTRLTPGLLLVFIANPIGLGTYIAVVVQFGIGAAMGAMLVSHVAVLLLARFLPRMRPLFPPEVIGVVVLMLGISLIPGGMSRSAGLDAGHGVSASAGAAALATIACIVVFSVWGRGFLRTIAALIGVAAGIAVAFAIGETSLAAFGTVGEMPALAIPLLGLALPRPEFVPVAIATVLLVELFSAMDMFACALTMDKLNDAKWRRADMPLVSRALTGYSLVNMLLGAAGQLSSGFSSANIGLAHSSGVMSRHVGMVAGAMLCAIAFVPAVPALIVATPAPVLGAILVYTAAFMIVAGMDLALSRLLNAKRTFTVGLSVTLGTAVMLVPETVAWAPDWSRSIVESGLTVGSLVAVILNMVFRIGVKRRAELALPEAGAGEATAAFLEHHGRIWGARQDVIVRAGTAVSEALEAIREAGLSDGPATLAVSFDEFNLVCRLAYPGRPLALAAAQPVDPAAMLEAEDEAALDSAMMRLPSLLMVRLADRVQAGARNGRAELRLYFNH